MLVDWDTVLVAPPERDLWLLDPGDGSFADAYRGSTGREVLPPVLDLYRSTWDLSDIVGCLTRFTGGHGETAEDRAEWRILNRSLSLSERQALRLGRAVDAGCDGQASLSLMGINDWRAKRQIKYPERGVLRVIGRHDEHSRPSKTGTRIAGIITAPGMPAARIEHKMEEPARWEGVTAVPVTVDRNDPAKFVVMWEELESGAWQDPGDVNPAGAGAPGGYGPNVIRTSASIRIGPDNMPINVPIPPEAAARVQSAVGKLFGQGRGGVLGQALSEAVGQALNQATGVSYGQQPPMGNPYNQSYDPQTGQPYSQQPPAGQPYGQQPGQSYDPQTGRPYGQQSPASQHPGQPSSQHPGQSYDPQTGQPYGQHPSAGQPHGQHPSAGQPAGQPGGQPGGFAQVDPQAFHQPFGEVDPEAFRSPEDQGPSHEG